MKVTAGSRQDNAPVLYLPKPLLFMWGQAALVTRNDPLKWTRWTRSEAKLGPMIQVFALCEKNRVFCFVWAKTDTYPNLDHLFVQKTCLGGFQRCWSKYLLRNYTERSQGFSISEHAQRLPKALPNTFPVHPLAEYEHSRDLTEISIWDLLLCRVLCQRVCWVLYKRRLAIFNYGFSHSNTKGQSQPINCAKLVNNSWIRRERAASHSNRWENERTDIDKNTCVRRNKSYRVSRNYPTLFEPTSLRSQPNLKKLTYRFVVPQNLDISR